jgi:hypothetical protein
LYFSNFLLLLHVAQDNFIPITSNVNL